MEPRSGSPINAAVEVLGDRWTLLVLRDVIFGDRRYFRALLTGSIEGIASNILADRLKRLIDAGILARGGVEPLERVRAAVRLRRGVKVTDAQLVHEFIDERRTLIAHELLPGPELVAAGPPVEAPVAQGVDDRYRLDPCFSQAEASALPPGCGAAGEDLSLIHI